MEKRSFVAESALTPGYAAVFGVAENAATAPAAGGAGVFAGVFAAKSDPVAVAAGDHVTLVLHGPCKVVAGGAVSKGDTATLKTDVTGKLVKAPTAVGKYATCGFFLEDGADGDYVDFFVQRGSLTITA
jgi:hypothetical protein